jgi:hypothetical protein
LEKELILEEVSSLAGRLRQQAAEGRADTLHLAKRVNDYQSRIRQGLSPDIARPHVIGTHSGPADTARHVMQHITSPRFLSQMTSYDVPSNACREY